jgi:hypothetical protein
MRKALGIFVVVAGVALAAWAAEPRSKPIDHESVERFKNHVILEKSIQGGITIGTNGAAISKSPVGTLIYNFPALSGPNTTLGTVCAASPSFAVSDAGFPATCVLGVDQVPVNAFGTLIPYVASEGFVFVQACASGITDGGSFDMPDATYSVRCFNP